MLKQLQKNMTAHGYRQVSIDMPGLYLYYDEDPADRSVVLISDWTDSGMQVEQYYQIYVKAGAFFYHKWQQEVSVFQLVLSGAIESARETAGRFGPFWILEPGTGKLVIYEDQPGTYGNLQVVIKETYHPPAWYKKVGWVNAGMILICVFVFILMEITGSTYDVAFMLKYGASYPPLIRQGEYYRLVTSMFMHFGLTHLINNMVVLAVVGNHLEKLMGSMRYFFVYMISGLGGSLLSFFCELAGNGEYAVSAGASGAVFGVIGALFYVVVLHRGRVRDMTSRRLGMLIVLSLFHGFTSTGVDNIAHVGGLLAGMLTAVILYRKKKTINI